MLFNSRIILASLSLLPALAAAQLSGHVGPLTSRSSKATKTCNVLDYGAKADKSTDLGPPLTSAHAACKSGGTVVIPSGDYALKSWVTLNGGSKWALQWDGTIYRSGTSGGNMIFIEHTNDIEIFSSTSKGAFQGLGYEFHKQGSLSGPRILRLYDVSDFSVHDLILVDAPAFHFSMDTCKNGEVYNMAIRGGNSGGLDGIDVWSTNMWIHDIMVTNKDECVTVKSPSQNILIENIYCNRSGGCAFGSLGSGTDISNVIYRNVYTWTSNQMMMIKSNGGSGTVSNVLMENFIGHGNAYSLDIDQYWSSMDPADGSGVKLNNITFKNWKGTEADGSQRGPIKVICADGTPCTSITITDFAMWTESGSKQWYACRSAYGSGFCLKSGSGGSYSVTTTTVSSAPSGYTATSMKEDLASDFGTTASIPIPTFPASFFPGVAPYSKLMASGGGGSSITTTAKIVSTSTKATSTTFATSTKTTSTGNVATSTSASGTVAKYGQCGGTGYPGPTTCENGSTCHLINDWYSQCY